MILGKSVDLTSYDVATDAAGTAYIGWIGAPVTGGSRTVHLCTLPIGASRCEGGIQTTDPLNAATAAGLRVLSSRTGRVTLVWFHQTTNSGSGPQGSAIAMATAPKGLNLGAAHDTGSAPSNGELLDAELGPDGKIWTVAYAGVGTNQMQVRDGSANYNKLHTPWYVSTAKLAFAGRTPVLVANKYGAVSTPPPAWATTKNGKWTGFTKIPKTWALSSPGLASTGSGVRLISTVNDSSYRPVVARWTGHGFTPRTLTADRNNCYASSHDAVSDPSGRLLDVSWECNDVTVSDYPDGQHAAIFRMHVKGTPTFTPQIASGTRGVATVVWSTESVSGGSDLRAVHFRLPASTHGASKQSKGGGVTVTGPFSCLPAVSVHVGVKAKAKPGWKLTGTSLRLGKKVIKGSSLDGATLKPGTRFELHGTARFVRKGKHVSATATLTFRTCASH